MGVHSIRQLTDRQREIAECIGRGLNYDEIAEELGMSAHTVRSHVRNLANLIDVDDGALSPRERILMLVKYEQWERERTTSDSKRARGAKGA